LTAGEQDGKDIVVIAPRALRKFGSIILKRKCLIRSIISSGSARTRGGTTFWLIKIIKI